MESCHSSRWCVMHSDSFCPALDPPSQYSGIVCSRSQHIPAICWAQLMIAKTYTWCIFMDKNCFRFSSNKLTKAWHPLDFTCLVLVFHFVHIPKKAGIESLTTPEHVLSRIWWWQELLTCEASQSSALIWLTKRMLFLSTPFLLPLIPFTLQQRIVPLP